MNKKIIDNAIEIKSTLKSSRLSIFKLDKNVTLEKMDNCPACLKSLKTVVRLINQKTKVSVRIGVCSGCGYAGYQDRPTLKWIANFYSNDWDKEHMLSTERMKMDVNLPKGNGPKSTRYHAFELHRKIEVNKDKPYFEIGSGYGQVMKNFEIAGFKKLYGIENSIHRAEMVNKVFGYKIFKGDFGNPDLMNDIKKYGPYGLIFSHHVLEHVYNPGEVIKSMSLLQDEGDYAIFSLPDAAGEHINYLSLYLPHLHGFTRESLEKLFNRYGYEMILDESPNILNIVMAFKKTVNPKTKLVHNINHIEEYRNRLINGLCLNKMDSRGYQLLKWEQDIIEKDNSEISKLKFGILGWYFMQVISYIKSRIFKKMTAYYIMLIRPAKKIIEDDIIEIQFNGDINFLIK